MNTQFNGATLQLTERQQHYEEAHATHAETFFISVKPRVILAPCQRYSGQTIIIIIIIILLTIWRRGAEVTLGSRLSSLSSRTTPSKQRARKKTSL